ncbi:MAG: DUF5050 domain-containing protein [Bacillota bacterium]
MRKTISLLFFVAVFVVNLFSGYSFAAGDLVEVSISGRVLTPEGVAFVPGENSVAYVGLSYENYEEFQGLAVCVQYDGSFVIEGNIPSGNYKLYAEVDGYENPFFHAEMVSLHISEGGSITRDMILTYPQIKGRVLKPDGTPYIPEEGEMTSVDVRPMFISSIGGYGIILETDGSYKLGNIPEGKYNIKACLGNIESLYTDSKTHEVYITTARTDVRDLYLTEPSITGKIFKPDGSLLIPDNNTDVRIYLYTADSGRISVAENWIRSDGTFRLGGDVVTGDYILQAQTDIFGNGNFPYSDSVPVAIHVEEGIPIIQDICLTGQTKYKISGYIKPDFDFTNQDIVQGFRVEIPYSSYWAATDSTGYFEINGVPEGVIGYTLKVSKDNYLKRYIDNVIVNGDTQIGSKERPVDIWVGDMLKDGIQDEAINLEDIMEIIKVFNTGYGNPNYNQSCDLNLDNSVNMEDIMLIARHFNKSPSGYPDIEQEQPVQQDRYGNNAQNINYHFGTLAAEGDYIYFSNNDDEGKLYKMHYDGSGKVKLSDNCARSINVLDGWIYYIADYAGQGGKIVKQRVDGTEKIYFEDTSAQKMIVVNDWIYYIGLHDTGEIIKIKTDGSQKTVLYSGDFVHNIYVVGDWVYFNRQYEENHFVYSLASRIRVDGTELSVIKDKYTYLLTVNQTGLYYRHGFSSELIAYKADLNGGNPQEISDCSIYLNVDDNGDIYYYENGLLKKLAAVNGETTKIADVQMFYVADIFLTPDWVFFSQYIDGQYKLYRVSKEGGAVLEI